MGRALFFLVFSLGLLGGSCGRKESEERIQLPPTPVLSIRSNWAVVRSPFLRIRDEPFEKAKVLVHLRRGSILEILSRTEKKETLDTETSYWYQVNYEGLRGWAFGAYLEILDTKTRAEAFARTLQ